MSPNVPVPHRWDLTPKEAVALQRELAGRVVAHGLPTLPEGALVAGVDCSIARFSRRLHAGVVLCRVGSWEVVEQAVVEVQTPFPYVPGLLSFRELPGILPAFEKLSHTPDVLLVDGNGRMHPRRLGIASHLGVLLDLPTIGCGKSRLLGTHEEPAPERGSWTAVYDDEEVIAHALRTRDRVKPVYVSVGHRVDLDTARKLLLQCTPKYRLPEPIRRAHDFVGEARRAAEG